MSRSLITFAISAAVAVLGCGDDDARDGTFELPSSAADRYPTAYIAAVVPDPPGDDLTPGGGEHVVIRNNASIRIDMGGWWIDTEAARLPVGTGRQIDVDAEVRIHPGSGNTGPDAVFVGLDEEVLGNEGGVLVLRDAAGSEVARFAYGTQRNEAR